ncbi:DUF7096 domain-containing protein [Haloarcula marina]|uniref:DUF7096 domain-containing protein n=1 Tax=Haloarcula marina TaxID=2961574 RepID=UPI0020B63AEF|nr:hypothetical protein [Halomicroarcula marina]
MRRATLVVVAVLVASVLAGLPAAAMAQETATQTQTQTDQSSANETVAPGAQLAGAVGVQGAELEGEVQSRAFNASVDRARDDDARAAVVAAQSGRLEERLAELEQRREALEAARENGSMSQSEYRARVAQLHASSRATERLAAQTGERADRLPAETLEANGVNVTAIRSLAQRSAELTGPEVAEIARGIAGPNAGERPGRERAGGPAEREDRGMGAGPAERGADASEDAANRTANETDDGADEASVSFGTSEDRRIGNGTTANETSRAEGGADSDSADGNS